MEWGIGVLCTIPPVHPVAWCLAQLFDPTASCRFTEEPRMIVVVPSFASLLRNIHEQS